MNYKIWCNKRMDYRQYTADEIEILDSMPDDSIKQSVIKHETGLIEYKILRKTGYSWVDTGLGCTIDRCKGVVKHRNGKHFMNMNRCANHE